MARVAVAFNDDLHRKPHLNEIEKIGEAESGETAREIAAILGADIIGVGDDLRGALETLSTYDEVFNLCEGVLGIPRWEMHFATALEMLGIPFTGCEPLAVAICTDKILVKRLLAAAGVPVPRSDVLPAIVKPSREDAGVGIDAASIVFNERELHDRVKWVEGTYGQPALVEEFIDGREFNQSLFLDRALPAPCGVESEMGGGIGRRSLYGKSHSGGHRRGDGASNRPALSPRFERPEYWRLLPVRPASAGHG
jgi:D-alanine-D-alanine ligase